MSLIVVGNIFGGLAGFAVIWTSFATTNDVGSPLMAMLTLLLGAIVGAVAGSVAGLLIWNKLRTLARESGAID